MAWINCLGILTDDFLDERLAYYEGVSRAFGLDDIRDARQYRNKQE